MDSKNEIGNWVDFQANEPPPTPTGTNPPEPVPVADHWRGIRAPEHVVEAYPTSQNNSYIYRRANETLR